MTDNRVRLCRYCGKTFMCRGKREKEKRQYCSQECWRNDPIAREKHKRACSSLSFRKKIRNAESYKKASQTRHKNALENRVKLRGGVELDITNGELLKYRELHPVCEMCGLPCSTGRELARDHNHKTNHFRGLLCMKCNRHLGWFEENREKVLDYLRTHDTI